MICHWLILSFPVLLIVITTSYGARDLFKCPTRVLKGGKVRTRSRGRVIKYICARGFQVLGDKYSTCVRGKWDTPTPFCISSGCAPMSVAHSQSVVTYRGALTTVHCDPGYSLVGSPALRCDSRVWNASAPVCQEIMVSSQTSCDFENEDLCGWTHDNSHDFEWKRHNLATPSGDYGTGPSFDHTLGQGSNGHYMYVESSSPRLINDTARLFSPFYPTPSAVDNCFILWYHMYGTSTGTLNVYLHGKETVLLFSQSGDHGNQWTKAVMALPYFRSSFQIVIEGVRGSGFAGDIAIDDVRLAEGEDCFPTSTTTDEEASTTYETEHNNSCESRCHAVQADSALCECTADCVANSTCCPDYLVHCASPTPGSTQQETNPPITEKFPTSIVNTQTRVPNPTDYFSTTHKTSSSVLGTFITTIPVKSPDGPQSNGNSNNTLTTLFTISNTTAVPLTVINLTSGKTSSLAPVFTYTKPPMTFPNNSSATVRLSPAKIIPHTQYKTSTPTSLTNVPSSKISTAPTQFTSTVSTSSEYSPQNMIPTSAVVVQMPTRNPNSDQFSTRKFRFPLFTIVRATMKSSTPVPESATSTAQRIPQVTNNESFDLENTTIHLPQYTIKPISTTTTKTTRNVNAETTVTSSKSPFKSVKIKLPKIEFVTSPPPIVYRTPAITTQNYNTTFQPSTTTGSTTASTIAPKHFKPSTKAVWKSKNDVLHPSWRKTNYVQHLPIVSTLNSVTTQSTSSTSRKDQRFSSNAKKYFSKEPKRNKEVQHKVESEGTSPVHDHYAGTSPSSKKDIFTLVCVCLLFLSALLVALSVLRRRKFKRNTSEYDELDIHFLPSDEILDFTIARPSRDDSRISESVR